MPNRQKTSTNIKTSSLNYTRQTQQFWYNKMWNCAFLLVRKYVIRIICICTFIRIAALNFAESHTALIIVELVMSVHPSGAVMCNVGSLVGDYLWKWQPYLGLSTVLRQFQQNFISFGWLLQYIMRLRQLQRSYNVEQRWP
jgi:hypothetical protein